MINIVKQTILEHQMIQKGDKVLCALSGGADSVVMTLALIYLSKQMEFTICACHLNHDLRGQNAESDALFCEKFCKEHQIEFICEKVSVEVYAKEHKKSIEHAAREVRYDFFERTLKTLAANKIATAHNANDVAETMIMNLTRGTGIVGLCSIPKIRGNIIRPLIETSRNEIEKFAKENNIQYVTDETNLDIIYTRNKIRHNVITELCNINSGFIKNINKTTKLLNQDADFLENIAAVEMENNCIETEKGYYIKVFDINCLHIAISSRIIRNMYEKISHDVNNLSMVQVESILNLCKSDNVSASLELPKNIIVRRQYDMIFMEKIEIDEENNEINKVHIKLGEVYSFKRGKIEFCIKKIEKAEKVNKKVNNFYISCDKINVDKLYIRTRITHDKIKLSHKTGTKTLKKLFIEKKIPKIIRDEILILCDDIGIIAVCDLGVDINRTSDKDDLKIEFKTKGEQQ